MTKRPLNVIGPLIRRLRVEQGLSQEVLAGRINEAGWNLSRATLAQIEAQLRGLHDHEMLLIAIALKVDAVRLLPTKNEVTRLLKPFWPPVE